ncbi:MAG: hypothetical protein AAB575_01330 [Patescibacteria group bacterium]
MEKPKVPDKATDIEQAMFLIGHIEQPCHDLQGNSLRDFYLREAIKTLAQLKDQSAKELLKETINKFKE